MTTIIPSFPYTLQNNTTADATQVQANFNQIQNDVNTNAAENGANSSITSLSGLTTALSVGQGGTGATAAGATAANNIGALAIASNLSDLNNTATAQTNLGLGSIATQAASAVAVTGGTLSGVTISSSTITGHASLDLAAASNLSDVASGPTALANIGGLSSASHAVAAAWVVFAVSGGVVTVKGSYNVSSVVRTANGAFTVNFTTPFADNNLAVVGACSFNSQAGAVVSYGTQTTGHVTLLTAGPSTQADPTNCSICVFH